MTGTAIVLIVNDFATNNEKRIPQQVFGIAFGALILLFIAQANESFASILAWLVFVAALMSQGATLFKIIGAGPKKPSPTAGYGGPTTSPPTSGKGSGSGGGGGAW